MLTSFKVKSFKSLEDVEVELGRVNVFIGANGSGKSNLLEAIGMLGAAANGRVDDEALLRRGVRPGLPELYKSSFRDHRQSKEIRFLARNGQASLLVGLVNSLKTETDWRFGTEVLKEGRAVLVRRDPSLIQRLSSLVGYVALKAVELPAYGQANQLLTSLQEFAIYSPDTATLRGLATDPHSREPLGLKGGRLAEALETTLRSMKFQNEFNQTVLEMIEWSDSIGMFTTQDTPLSKSIPQPTKVLRFRDKYMATGRNILSGFDVSEGALYVLFMAALIHHPKSSAVVAVDNFDQALNPRLARALTSRVCEWVKQYDNKQLFLTSHNASVLDGLPLLDDTIRLFTVSRSSLGKTLVQRVLVNEDIIQRAKNGIPLSQQWIMGVFGGVPSI